MSVRAYLVVSGCIFALVAVFHLLRAVNGWELVLGPWSAPPWVSWLGTLVPAVLAGWALRAAPRV